MLDLYYKYQPVTWYVGVIEATPEDVAHVIQPLYAPPDRLCNIYNKNGPIDKALTGLQPIGLAEKFLLIETEDGRTALFGNAFYCMVELPTWTAGKKLNVSAYFACKVPNTISRDHRSGAYGARSVEYRRPENPYGKEPTFGIYVIRETSRWHFYRYGEKLPFEDEKAYKSLRKPNRFTEEMLVKYCRELGIPVYDRDFYSNSWIIVERKIQPNEKGISYEEAALKFRIKQEMQGSTMP